MARLDFADLFREQYPRIYRYVRYRVDDDLVAEDLTPSETANLDRGRVLGFATLLGGTKRTELLPRIGHFTAGYMPAAKRPPGLETSSSTGIDLVFGSMERAIRLIVP